MLFSHDEASMKETRKCQHVSPWVESKKRKADFSAVFHRKLRSTLDFNKLMFNLNVFTVG